MKIKKTIFLSMAIAIAALCPQISFAQNDTIRVMTYNTLNFGPDGCQTPNGNEVATTYPYLKSIIKYANPDIVGLDKMVCVKTSINDVNGIASPYFPDTVISECLNAAYPGRFSFCPFTDLSLCTGGNSDIIFYNTNKLGYISTTPLYWGSQGGEDIDLFKLYYKQWFTGFPDTTYLYVVLCHTISSSANSIGRDGQDSIIMNKLRAMFTQLPNLIYMGDFNTRGSTEPGYGYITQTNNANYTMDDPPFTPDGHLTYPDDWDGDNVDQAYFTTSTRTSTIPNACGTTGGAKDWYDHIFLSTPIVNGSNNITYVHNSYKTIGNNGNRSGINVYDSTTNGKNTSVPSSVANALFNFSDKYPVEVTLAVTPVLAVKNIQSEPGSIKVNNPIENNLVIHFASYLNGQDVSMGIYDVCGRNLLQSSFNVVASTMNKNVSLIPGVYFIHFTIGGYSTTLKVVKE